MVELAPADHRLPRPAGGRRGVKNILAHHQRQVVRELALGLVTRSNLARQYGVTAGAITRFAAKHQKEIDELRAALGDKVAEELAGLWIAKKENRIAMYQHIAETDPDNKVVVAALRAVAEELGQFTPKPSVVVMPVTHTIVGVDVDLLK